MSSKKEGITAVLVEDDLISSIVFRSQLQAHGVGRVLSAQCLDEAISCVNNLIPEADESLEYHSLQNVPFVLDGQIPEFLRGCVDREFGIRFMRWIVHALGVRVDQIICTSGDATARAVAQEMGILCIEKGTEHSVRSFGAACDAMIANMRKTESIA